MSSPKQRLLDRISAQQQSGALSATDADALNTATNSPTVNIVASALSFTIFPSSPIAK